MKKYILTAVAVGVFSLAGIGGASAAEQPRPSKANDNASCVGQISSAFTHNGQAGTLGNGGDPNHKGGLRGDEIQGLQDLAVCPV